MELKHLISQFAYRIEPKPEGGFIARATDPSVPPIEAATREELRKQIQAKIFSSLADEFPSLKLAADGSPQQFAFHIEHTPGGGFSIHSADPDSHVIHASSETELENHFLEKVIGFAGKHMMPELAQALAAKGLSGDIKVTVNRASGVSLKSGSHELSFALANNSPPPAAVQNAAQAPKLDDAIATSAAPKNLSAMLDSAPITPERSSLATFFRLLLAFAVIAALVFFFLNRR